ncbi:MAG: DUF4383 domain-containing protein [Gemmatimonadaceae bacterium]
MTTVQRVAQIFGVLFTVGALAGFYASGMSMEADHTMAPKALGLFPVNLLHNVVHLVFGIWGLAAARSFTGAKQYAQITGVIYTVLIAVGFFVPDGFGLIPLGGNDIWLHVILGLPLLYFGFMSKPDPVAPIGTAM